MRPKEVLPQKAQKAQKGNNRYGDRRTTSVSGFPGDALQNVYEYDGLGKRRSQVAAFSGQPTQTTAKGGDRPVFASPAKAGSLRLGQSPFFGRTRHA